MATKKTNSASSKAADASVMPTVNAPTNDAALPPSNVVAFPTKPSTERYRKILAFESFLVFDMGLCHDEAADIMRWVVDNLIPPRGGDPIPDRNSGASMARLRFQK